ncbi:hypothetical protein M426DRAFT_324357 [Hypoxylon sp. CI-4A]|nr:hypothetical protein M426DRAFT_324357 [Hypoxylon sp. CI-4A]
MSTRSLKKVREAFAKRIYRTVGFSKASNFWLWFLLGGALLGFALARAKFLDFHGTFCGSSTGGRDGAIPGECFYHLQPGWYNISIRGHLITIVPASFLVCLQFTPVVRRKALRFHRISGWIATVLSIPGAITSGMVSPRAQGGGVDTQSMVWLLVAMFLYAVAQGCIDAKRHKVAQHRAWMLRAWVYAGAIVTMRIFITIFIKIISWQGGYYYAEPCDKINFILQSEEATLASYPECASFFSGENLDRHAAVLATIHTLDKVQKAAAINMVFGTSGWAAIFLHTVGVEYYLYSESVERNASSRLQPAADIKRPDQAVLAVDDSGSKEKQTSKYTSKLGENSHATKED